jgi:hypothetical protein
VYGTHCRSFFQSTCRLSDMMWHVFLVPMHVCSWMIALAICNWTFFTLWSCCSSWRIW